MLMFITNLNMGGGGDPVVQETAYFKKRASSRRYIPRLVTVVLGCLS